IEQWNDCTRVPYSLIQYLQSVPDNVTQTDPAAHSMFMSIQERLEFEQARNKELIVYAIAGAAARELSPNHQQVLISWIKQAWHVWHVRIVSGEEEAAFGFLAVLSDPRRLLHLNADIGWIEIGMDSVQFAWLTNEVIDEHFFALP